MHWTKTVLISLPALARATRLISEYSARRTEILRVALRAGLRADAATENETGKRWATWEHAAPDRSQKGMITLSVPTDTLERLRQRSDQSGLTFPAVMTRAIEIGLWALDGKGSLWSTDQVMPIDPIREALEGGYEPRWRARLSPEQVTAIGVQTEVPRTRTQTQEARIVRARRRLEDAIAHANRVAYGGPWPEEAQKKVNRAREDLERELHEKT